MTQGQALLETIENRADAMIEALRVIVEHETPSLEKSALDGLARALAARLEAVGGAVKLVTNSVGGDHVLATFGPSNGERPGLVLGHYDTVWPSGTIGRMPFRVDAGQAFGPGVYDMKASLVMVEAALDAVRSRGLILPRPIVVLFTSDEEIGSPRSRALLEEAAGASDYVLVMEPPLANGALKTARKGVGHYSIAVEGRAAHAGVEPEKGVNAIVELAHQILAVTAIARPEAGTTLTVGIVSGGTRSNVVPAYASATIDGRITVMSEAARVSTAMDALRPVLHGAKVTVTGAIERPPMERTPGVAALYERVRAIGATLGLDLREGSTGGASDGNFTAALGVPTLDGLGSPGGGAHAEGEHIEIAGFLERTALLALLLVEL